MLMMGLLDGQYHEPSCRDQATDACTTIASNDSQQLAVLHTLLHCFERRRTWCS